MSLFRSIAMAFSMFSRIPMPMLDWEKMNMRSILAALPLVGAVSGLLLWGWILLCGLLRLSPFMTAAGLTLLPLLFTGGVHMDGLADTADALACHGSKEKKREILKDPHIGAFGVMAIAIYLIWQLAVYTELAPHKETYIIFIIPVLSRTASALLSLLMPRAAESGLLHTFRDAANKIPVVIILLLFLAAAAAAMICIDIIGAIFTGAALLAAAGLTVFICKRNFGAISGDLAGYCIQISELFMITALLLCQKAVI